MTLDLQAIQGLIVLVVPILIYLTRLYLPRIPKNLYPVLAPVIGAALDIVLYQGGLTTNGNPVTGAILGGLGTWLREAQDQLKRPFEPPTGTSLKCLLAAALLLGVSGCVMLPWSSQLDVADQIRLVKTQGGSGCVYLRVTGTYPGFASGSALIVEAYDASGVAGGAAKARATFLDCLKAIPAEARAPLLP